MKRILLFIASAILSATALAQLTQPPGGITGNMPPWSGGNGTSGQILTSRGTSLAPTFQVAPSGAAGANPSALVGPTATNGVATTFLRSDGAPAIDLTAAYPWTGIHTFSTAEPRLKFNETDQGTDLKLWDADLNGGVFCIRTRTDADGAGQNALCATRGATTALINISLGNTNNNPTYTLLGTGSFTLSGSLLGQAAVLANLQLNSASAPGSPGFSRPAANTIGVTGALTSLGTKFTAAGTGCTVGTTVGGASAGTFTLATGPCTTVVITINGATGSTAANGWSCWANDTTATTVLISQSTTTTTTATFTIPAGAGATDVIRFGCIGY